MDLFKRKGSKSLGSKSSKSHGYNNDSDPSPSTPPPPTKSPKSRKGSILGRTKSSTPPPPEHFDDFGRPVTAHSKPAFSSLAARAPPLSFGNGYGVGDDDEKELLLVYGYMPLATTLELRLDQVDLVVTRCAAEIRERGLDTPLVLSTMSLDISADDTSNLIRSYLPDANEWAYSLHLASPLAVGSFLKWGLARLLNEKGERGFLSWDSYESWKTSERATAFPPRHCSNALLGRLPPINANILCTLLTLFSSVAAYSGKNGLTPRKLAGLFSPYVFGLADDKPFDETYTQWMRSTDAFEHILLAFIRDQQATGRIPTHLEKFIIGYPSILNITYSSTTAPKVPKGGRVEEVTRVRRLTRFHSKNLIQTAGTWEVPNSRDWELFYPSAGSAAALATAGSSENGAGNQGPTPIFTPHYRHLLNIRSHSFLDDDDDDGELQRYKTVVGKNWGKFAELGFSDVETGKLEFDLTESERTNIRAQRESLDWGTFASSGFGGRETFAPQDLIFRQNLIAKIQTYPASQSALNQRLREAEKQLPAFPYDTTPHEEGRILVDINFFEAWADVLVSSGWARDELKESSFALIQWKSRVRDGELPRGRPMENDDRTEERWILVEEVVPREYREELRDGKKKPSKRASFLRSVRKKPREPVRLNVSQVNNTPLATIPASPPATVSRRIDDSVFQEKGPEGATKLMSLSSVALDAQTAYAPSFVSTTGAGHGHESIAERPSEESNPPLPQSNMRLGPPIGLGNGVGGTYSSQRADTKTPAQAGAKGFLARMGSRKVSGGKSPYGQGISSAASAVNSNSAGDSHEPVDSRSGSTVNLNDGRTNVPWNHPPTVSTSTSISSIPPSPPPKRTHDEEPNNRQSDYTRSSYISSTEGEDSPYDGIEDGEEVQEGTVLFRGSRLISQEVGRQALLAPPLATIAQGQEGDQEEVLPPPVGMPTSPARQPLPRLLEPVRPARHDSLPPSPKPDADAPIDEGSQRDKFMSGASAYAQQMKASNASRVSSIVGMYEVRDQGVRLTQYGFGDPQQVSSV